MTLRLPVACLAAAITAHAGAAPLRTFILDTPKALAGATGHGVAIYPDGTLRALPPLSSVATFDEPLALALAVAADGTAFVGTGHPARVWRVTAAAKTVVAELAADQITALVLDPSGCLWAATEAPATLVRMAAGRAPATVVARLAEGNLWDLGWHRGALVAAAGNPGRVLRLAGDRLETLAAIPDRHARCLLSSGDNLFIGTSGKGFVLRIDATGALGVLYDSGFTEIAALAAGDDGIIWAAGLTGDPTLGQPAKDGADATVTVSDAVPTPPPAPGGGSATSEIIRILPSGAATTAHRFAKPIAGTLSWGAAGLVIGTGIEGEIWQLADGAAAQLDDVAAAQVTRVAAGGDWVLTQGPVTLFHRGGAPHGTFTSPVLDAGQPARWGEARLGGGRGPADGCTVRFRSGLSATPDETWSAWTAAAPCPGAVVAAPPARYLQWQVGLSASQGGEAPRVGRVTVPYRQLNLPPEIKEFTVHEPGEVFLKSAPAADKIVEVQHPDLNGIFTTLDDDPPERQATLGKKYWRVGTQSLSWKAEDANADPLRFTLEVQPVGGEGWWTVRRDLEVTVVALDSQALADGDYRFRLTASDEAANPGEAATAQAISPVVVVDNTAPVVTVTRNGRDWLISVEDALSAIVRVEWNRDADQWHPLFPQPEQLGSRRVTARIQVAPGRHTLAVRAVDDHHNRAVRAVQEGK